MTVPTAADEHEYKIVDEKIKHRIYRIVINKSFLYFRSWWKVDTAAIEAFSFYFKFDCCTYVDGAW